MQKQRNEKGQFVRTTPDYKAMYEGVERELAEAQKTIAKQDKYIAMQTDELIARSSRINILTAEVNWLREHAPLIVRLIFKRKFPLK